MTTKQRLGSWLVRIGMHLIGDVPILTTPLATPKPSATKRTSRVIEATDETLTWTPDQKGNVVIVEPDIMTQFRKDQRNNDL